MTIPKKFKLQTKTFEVHYASHLNNAGSDPDQDILGLCHMTDGLIYIQKGLIDRELELQVYYHELAHALLYHADGSWQLTKNEELVDRLGHLLYQYDESKKGDLGTAVNKTLKADLTKFVNTKLDEEGE